MALTLALLTAGFALAHGASAHALTVSETTTDWFTGDAACGSTDEITVKTSSRRDKPLGPSVGDTLKDADSDVVVANITEVTRTRKAIIWGSPLQLVAD